jgi:hypothetical protein
MKLSFSRATRALCRSFSASLIVLGMATAATGQSIPSALVSYPELILHNGKILTVDERFSIAQAVAVRDGRFLKVGTNQEILALKGPATNVIDLQGRSVVPGFVDTHGHSHFVSPRGAGMVSGGNLTCETVDKCLEEIKAGVSKAKPGEWVRFGGVRNDILINQVTRVLHEPAQLRCLGKGQAPACGDGRRVQRREDRRTEWTHSRPGQWRAGP